MRTRRRTPVTRSQRTTWSGQGGFRKTPGSTGECSSWRLSAVGTRPLREFHFIGKPVPGWDGIVRCEVLEVRPPELLRYSWQGAENERPTEVAYRIEPHGDGTRLTYLHTGFSGIGGQIMSRLLGRVRRKMLDQGLPAVLAAIEPTQ